MASLPQDGLKYLAESTGLSVSTVSRVLSGKAAAYRISAETQERVRLAAGQQGIVVNEVARGLRLRTTQTIGLIIPDVSNPFFAALARQVEHLARAKGYSVLLADSQENADVEAESIRLMRSRRVDGLVIAPVGSEAPHLQNVDTDSLPIVLMDRIPAGYVGPSVTCDNRAAAKLAMRHLLEHGHRIIACLQGLPQASANQDRVSGYCEALAEAGLPFAPRLLVGHGYAIEAGRAAAHSLFLPSEGRPTALLSLGNLITLGALQALRALHLEVPKDVSIVSFDEQPWAEFIAPPLTTLSQPVELLAAKAMEMLFQQFLSTAGDSNHNLVTTGVREPLSLLLPVSLITRQSVAHIYSPE